MTLRHHVDVKTSSALPYMADRANVYYRHQLHKRTKGVCIRHHNMNPSTSFIIEWSIAWLLLVHHEYVFRCTPYNRSPLSSLCNNRERHHNMNPPEVSGSSLIHNNCCSPQAMRTLCDIREKRQFLLTRCWASGILTE